MADEHLRRLKESCQGMGRDFPCGPEVLKTWMAEALKESGFKNAVVRVSLHFKEDGGSLLAARSNFFPPAAGRRPPAGVAVAIFREFLSHPAELYEKGVSVQTAVERRWDFRAQDPQIKSSQFMSGVLAFIDKFESPSHEILLFSPMGTVAEGTVSNIFLISQKRLLTPSVASGILRGVTRELVMRLAREIGVPVTETFLTRHEFYSADECFMTNTSSEVLPVVQMDGRRIGDGRPGWMTQRLAEEFKRFVKKDGESVNR